MWLFRVFYSYFSMLTIYFEIGIFLFYEYFIRKDVSTIECTYCRSMISMMWYRFVVLSIILSIYCFAKKDYLKEENYLGTFFGSWRKFFCVTTVKIFLHFLLPSCDGLFSRFFSHFHCDCKVSRLDFVSFFKIRSVFSVNLLLK